VATRFQKLCDKGSKANNSNQLLILEEFQYDNEWFDVNAKMVHEDQAQVTGGDTTILWSHVDEVMGVLTTLVGHNFS
jgi:hypothetical protein